MTTYISIDMESDGPVPGKNSMLSIGAVAYDKFGNEVSRFSVNFEELPHAQKDPHTMNWWQNFLAQYEETRKFVVSPQHGMELFDSWLQRMHNLTGNSVLVAMPAAFDMGFFRHYYSFVRDPQYDIAFSCFDLQSAIAVHLKIPFDSAINPKYWPITWKSNMPPYTHVAVDDAKFQAELFVRFAKDSGLPL